MENFTSREFVPAAVFRFNSLSSSVQSHLRNVYGLLTLGFIMATVGSYLSMIMAADYSSLGFFGALGSLLYLCFSSNRFSAPNQTRVMVFLLFTFCKGLCLAPLLVNLIAMDMTNVIVKALLGTCVIFACFSGFALFSRDRRLLYLGGLLGSVLTILCLSSLLRLFTRSVWLFEFELYVGLLMFIGYVVFDTQQCIYHAERGEKDYVMHAVDLFIDFVAIFVRLAIILSRKEEKKRKERD